MAEEAKQAVAPAQTNEQVDRTVLILPMVQCWYPSLVEPRAFKEGEKPAWKLTVALPTNAEDGKLGSLQEAIKLVVGDRPCMESFIDNKWAVGNNRDLTKYPQYKDCTVFTCKNVNRRPPVWNGLNQLMTDEQIKANLNNGATVNIEMGIWYMSVGSNTRANCELRSVQLIAGEKYIAPVPVSSFNALPGGDGMIKDEQPGAECPF